jgi:hypothetical protein
MRNHSDEDLMELEAFVGREARFSTTAQTTLMQK